jgi:hypothetical protein
LQKITKHSNSKDKLLRASWKRIYQAQDFEDELGWEQETNQALLERIQELTASWMLSIKRNLVAHLSILFNYIHA